MRAAQERRMQGACNMDVVNVLALARDEGDVLKTGDAGSEVFRSHHAAPLILLRCSAVASAARTGPAYPVHRHRWPVRVSRTSCSVGSGLSDSSSVRLMRMPDVQNPHCR